MSDCDLPFFKFYPSDFIGDSDVQFMTATARGIYISLLCVQWQKGYVPNDKSKIAHVSGATLDDVENAWSDLLEVFDQTDKGLINNRLEEEREKITVAREKKKKAGKKGAKARWERDSDSDGDASGDASSGARGGATGTDSAEALAILETREPEAIDPDGIYPDTDTTEPEDKSADEREESTIDIDWLLDMWANLQPHDPSQSERQAQQNYVKYFDGYERQEVKEAMQGMNELFEYKDSGWGLKDLNNKFSKARGAFSENGDGSGDEPVLSYHQPYKPEVD